MHGGAKNWEWIKKGAPIRVEIGPRDVEKGSVAVARRDKPHKEKQFIEAQEFLEEVGNILQQIQSNLLNTNVIRPKTTETTALGVAFLAGLSTGFWKDIPSLKDLWIKDRSFQPNKETDTDKIVELWIKRINNLLKINE